ncbi:MAG: hypothetical protein WHS46_01860 [Desulfosoma sp.]
MPCRDGWKSRRPWGYTLVEVLVAVVVAVFVFVAFFALQTLGVRTRVHARMSSTALNAATDFLEQVSISSEDRIGVDGEILADSGFVEEAVMTGSGIPLARRWEVLRGVPGPHLMTVRVMVCWKEPQKPLPSAATCDFNRPSAPHVNLESVFYRPR